MITDIRHLLQFGLKFWLYWQFEKVVVDINHGTGVGVSGEEGIF